MCYYSGMFITILYTEYVYMYMCLIKLLYRSHFFSLANYRKNWIISACTNGVNSRALYAYNAVIFEPHPVTDVSVTRDDSIAS